MMINQSTKPAPTDWIIPVAQLLTSQWRLGVPQSLLVQPKTKGSVEAWCDLWWYGNDNGPQGPKTPKSRGGNWVDRELKWPTSPLCGYHLPTISWSNQRLSPALEGDFCQGNWWSPSQPCGFFPPSFTLVCYPTYVILCQWCSHWCGCLHKNGNVYKENAD